MSPEINKAIESGVSTYTLTGDYASGAVAFGMQLLSKIDKPEYVYSLTCEIDDTYIKTFKAIYCWKTLYI